MYKTQTIINSNKDFLKGFFTEKPQTGTIIENAHESERESRDESDDENKYDISSHKNIESKITNKKIQTEYLDDGELSLDFESIKYIANLDDNNADILMDEEDLNPIDILNIVKPQNINVQIKTNLCIYYINKEIIHPFIEYLFILENSQMIFPFINIEFTGGEKDFKTHIMNETIIYLTETLSLYKHLNSRILKKMFKGFILKEINNENQELTYELFMFFEYLHKFPKLQLKNTQSFAIMDEILFLNKIQNIFILNDIVNIFKENAFLCNIYVIENKQKRLIKPPSLMYLCCISQNQPDIIQYSLQNLHNVTNEDNIYFLFNKHIFHPFFNRYMYIFSNFLLSNSDQSTSTNHIRYVVFTNIQTMHNEYTESYLVKPINEINESQKTKYLNQISEQKTSTFYFKENDIQLWGIEYPNQFMNLEFRSLNLR
jgi:hypothetical protein